MDDTAEIAERNTRLKAAWRDAAADLGIEVEDFEDLVLVKDFGGKGGTITGIGDWKAMRRNAGPLGAGFSNLSSDHLEYDRATYVEMLSDWGWCGASDPPDWYEDSEAEDLAS